MTDYSERIAALEAALAAERRERETWKNELDAVKATILPHATETRRGLETLEENFGLTMKAVDERLAGLARGKGTGEAVTQQEFLECMRELIKAIDQLHTRSIDEARKWTEQVAEMLTKNLMGEIVALQKRLVYRIVRLELALGVEGE
jgi:hypothetical protein